ncbi:hypothetical protein UPYG_G00275730 [Umbra pygmaea]|uniref:Uncharacterized protein n=1 Tax=Umbra pygmaea TaxID=75934 RepID=A0ABD0W283_UMBPY
MVLYAIGVCHHGKPDLQDICRPQDSAFFIQRQERTLMISTKSGKKTDGTGMNSSDPSSDHKLVHWALGSSWCH